MNKTPIRILSVTLAILLLVSAFSVITITPASSSLSEFEPFGIDADVKTASIDTTEQVEPQGASHHSYWSLGQSAIWTGYNGYTGSIFLAYFTLSYIGTTSEIWVQNNINFPSGDPRNGPGGVPGQTKPTYAMLQYLANEFENNILPKESAFFGPPLYLNGSTAQLQYLSPAIPDDPEYYLEPSGRAVILVNNIRDQNYYDPTYPYKIIGVHISSYESYYYDRNIITIDAINWYHTLGPTGTVWGPHYHYTTNTIETDGVTTSPYAYESTVAHEWQHLLHYEYFTAGDEVFMNEGFSMYAEFLTGYGIDPDYPNSYFATPDNSLTEWGDQGDINILADYGAAALWSMYLSDRYGPAFLRLYFLLGTYGVYGIEGLDYAWYFSHYNERFPEVYRDWKLANLIRADSPGAGNYNYKSLNLNDPTYIPVRIYEVSGLPVPSTTGTSFGNTFTILGYDTGISRMSQWGTDYIALKGWNRPGHIYFDGDDVAGPIPSLWTMTADGWYSGTGVDLANFLLAGNALVSSVDPTLTLVTAYGLETLWDYGFVQVSTDGGATWTSLANAYTTTNHDPSAHPDIIANLPGLTDYNPDWPNWTTMSFDLTAYAGLNVMIGFRYMTDWATTYEGWWINSATVSGTALDLTPVPATFKASFQVTTVTVHLVDGKIEYIPNDMPDDETYNTGFAVEQAYNPNYVILVITPIMPAGTIDYTFEVTKLPWVSAGKLSKIDTGI